MKTIGAYEAKTFLPRLLDRVQRGESLTITRTAGPWLDLSRWTWTTGSAPRRPLDVSWSVALV